MNAGCPCYLDAENMQAVFRGLPTKHTSHQHHTHTHTHTSSSVRSDHPEDSGHPEPRRARPPRHPGRYTRHSRHLSRRTSLSRHTHPGRSPSRCCSPCRRSPCCILLYSRHNPVRMYPYCCRSPGCPGSHRSLGCCRRSHGYRSHALHPRILPRSGCCHRSSAVDATVRQLTCYMLGARMCWSAQVSYMDTCRDWRALGRLQVAVPLVAQ
jgi:hypothetical protein